MTELTIKALFLGILGCMFVMGAVLKPPYQQIGVLTGMGCMVALYLGVVRNRHR